MARKPLLSSTTRQRLLDAAHALIWANSYAHVSVDDICRKAAVQKGSFYHFFPTKIDLAIEALQDHWRMVEPKLEAIFKDHPTPSGQLKALCKAIEDKQKEAYLATGIICGCPYATVGAELSSNNAEMRAITKQMNARFCSYFIRLIENAVSAKLVPALHVKQRAEEMNTYVIGAMLQARLTNSIKAVGKPMENALFRISGIAQVPASTAKPRTGMKKH